MHTLETYISPRSISTELVERGYSFIPFHTPSGLIERIMSGWNSFLALPHEEKLRWRVGDPNDWDDGYVFRDKENKGNGEVYDHKDFFHFKPHLFALLSNAKVNYSQQISWLTDLNVLWRYCKHRFFLDFIKELDRIMPEHHLVKRFLSPVADTMHVVRLLSYREKMIPGVMLAKGHIDRNFGTFQIYESHPALVLELPNMQVPYRPVPNKVLAFTSGKAEIHTLGRVRGVKHSVITPPDYEGPCDAVRQSIVFFAHIY